MRRGPHLYNPAALSTLQLQDCLPHEDSSLPSDVTTEAKAVTSNIKLLT